MNFIFYFATALGVIGAGDRDEQEALRRVSRRLERVLVEGTTRAPAFVAGDVVDVVNAAGERVYREVTVRGAAFGEDFTSEVSYNFTTGEEGPVEERAWYYEIARADLGEIAGVYHERFLRRRGDELEREHEGARERGAIA